MLVNEYVCIKEIEPESLERLRNWRNNPEVRKFFRAYKDISKDMQKAWYESIGNNSNNNHIYFQIMYKNELIGVCGLHYIDWHIRSAEASIFVARNKGKGIGFKTLQLLCDYGFNKMNMHKIWCEIFCNNPRSLNLFKKVGFKLEGELRDNHFCDGKYFNSWRLSILDNEWPSGIINIGDNQ